MSKTVLVIDDDTLLRKSLTNVLAEKDMAVLEAGDGKQGLKILEETQVDLVITDIKMPVMDGLEMLKTMRQNAKTKTIPVMVLTADEKTESLNKAMEAGVTVYLSKSILDPQTIAEQAATVLGL